MEAKQNNSNKLLTTFKDSFKDFSMYYILAFIIILFQILTDGILLQPLNVTNLILQNSYILILAIGMLVLIVLGDIDLSVGATAAFVGAMAAIFTIKFDVPSPIAIVLCLLIGIGIGAFNGFWVAYVNVPAFIATLATQLVFRGLTIVALDGRTLSPFPDMIKLIGSGFIPDIFSGDGVHLFSLAIGLLIAIVFIYISVTTRMKKIKNEMPVETLFTFVAKIAATIVLFGAITFLLALYEGFPNVLVILAVLLMIYRFVTQRTVIGRHIYAIGGNEKAAALSGIQTKKIKFLGFMNMGFLAAIAGLVFSARLNAATATAGNGFELDAIAACYIGGASAYGGVGTVIGALIGGLVMGVLNNGMSLMGIGVDWQQSIKGLVLLMAVAFDIYSKSKSK